MLDKEQICLENGAKEFWVVDPIRRQVKVSGADGHAATYRVGQSVPLLFGGMLSLDSIFA
jgi:Uma2 family endonuclease